MGRLFRNHYFWILFSFSTLILGVWWTSLTVKTETEKLVLSDLSQLSNKRVGLLLGCSPKLSSGSVNPYFVSRIAAATELYRAGKVEYLLVSGDNHRRGYNEPESMRQELLALGVPADRIVLDYAGFSTLDSIVRAKEVFGLNELIVVTQRDHAYRALYIAKVKNIGATGFTAKDVSFREGLRTDLRESLARVRMFFDLFVWGREPKFLGERIVIGSQQNLSPVPTPAGIEKT